MGLVVVAIKFGALIWPSSGCGTHMRVSELEWVTRAQRVRYPPPPPIPYTFPGRLDPLVGAASGTTTSEAQRPHPGRIRKLRAGGVMGISVSAAPVGMASQT